MERKRTQRIIFGASLVRIATVFFVFLIMAMIFTACNNREEEQMDNCCIGVVALHQWSSALLCIDLISVPERLSTYYPVLHEGTSLVVTDHFKQKLPKVKWQEGETIAFKIVYFNANTDGKDDLPVSKYWKVKIEPCK